MAVPLTTPAQPRLMNHISFRALEDQVCPVACTQGPSSLGHSEGGVGPQLSCGGLKQRPALQGTCLAVLSCRGLCRGGKSSSSAQSKVQLGLLQRGGLCPLEAGKQTLGSRKIQVQPHPASNWLCALGLLTCTGRFFTTHILGTQKHCFSRDIKDTWEVRRERRDPGDGGPALLPP